MLVSPRRDQPFPSQWRSSTERLAISAATSAILGPVKSAFWCHSWCGCTCLVVESFSRVFCRTRRRVVVDTHRNGQSVCASQPVEAGERYDALFKGSGYADDTCIRGNHAVFQQVYPWTFIGIRLPDWGMQMSDPGCTTAVSDVSSMTRSKRLMTQRSEVRVFTVHRGRRRGATCSTVT